MSLSSSNYFLSIIVPVYNIKPEYLKKCFDSLVTQDATNFKVIVIDDGSTDDSGRLCDEYASKDERFSVIHQENAGVAVARNSGLEIVNTEWVTFVDPDDWVEKNHVSTIYRNVTAHEADIFLFDYFQEFASKTQPKSLMEQSGVLDDEWVRNYKISPFNFLMVNGKYYEYEHNTLWNKVYRKSMLKKASLCFDPRARKGQDNIFNAEALQLTNAIYYIHACLYHYRYLQESITNKFNLKAQYYNEVAFENYERIIKKYDLWDEYWDAYYARVVTRLYSCMRLYYFHEKNKQEKTLTYKELDETLSKYPYNTALSKVKNDQLTGTQRVFVFFLKRKQYGILRLLVKLRQKIKNMRGLRLK